MLDWIFLLRYDSLQSSQDLLLVEQDIFPVFESYVSFCSEMGRRRTKVLP